MKLYFYEDFLILGVGNSTKSFHRVPG